MTPETEITPSLLGFAETGHAAPRGEPFAERWRRRLLGLAWSLKHDGLAGVPGMASVLARHYFLANSGLPDPAAARAHPNGLAGVCSDLEPSTLVAAYASGLFPFAHVEPVKWWAPAGRMVLFIEDFEMEKNLRRRLRNGHFRVTFDQDFDAVIRGCAEARPGHRLRLTWVTPKIMAAYGALHEAGHAHSVEVWNKDGSLAGGCYGVAIGRVFFTESQFVRTRDASKVGFATLNRHLQHWGYVLNDGKMPTKHLAHLGFRLIPRAEFNAILARQCTEPGHDGRWQVDQDLDVGDWDPRAPI